MRKKEAANVIRRTRSEAGGAQLSNALSMQSLSETLGFEGPDLALVRENTVALMFNSASS
jgi:hypothetical protein